jgi:hypothetical protein
MRGTIRHGSAAGRGTLEHERSLINAAIALLVSGGADRVTLTGLRFADRLLPTAVASARLQGVVIRPLWRPGATTCDITVEPCG